MDKNAIKKMLEDEGFEEIDEIEYKNNIAVYDFFYVFDKEEIDSAKDYANENYDADADEDEWYNEYFLPYLSDIAADNVDDVLDDICEKYNLEGEFAAYELDKESFDQCEFTIVAAEEGTDFDIDKVIDDLEL